MEEALMCVEEKTPEPSPSRAAMQTTGPTTGRCRGRAAAQSDWKREGGVCVYVCMCVSVGEWAGGCGQGGGEGLGSVVAVWRALPVHGCSVCVLVLDVLHTYIHT